MGDQITIEEREQAFYSELCTYLERYPRTMLREFYDYWRERNKTGRKMRFEMEKTWDLNLRLQRWARTSKTNYNAIPNTTGTSTARIAALKNW